MASKGLSSVLVPTDFSPGAQLAVERALHLPLSPNAKVTLLHVLPDDIPGKLRQDALIDAERSLEKALAHVRTVANQRGLSLKLVGDVVEGKAPHQVMKRANTVEAQVICIGRHGKRGVIDLFVGSTATKVMRQTDRPVLLVQRTATAPYERPLLAIDPAHRALSVVRQALKVLGRTTVRINVLTATPIPYEDFISITDAARVEMRAKFEKDGAKALSALLKKFPGYAFSPVAKSGEARSLVVEEAKRHEADLTVVGTHGRTALNRFLMGSVAEWVLSHSTNDVLVVRP